MPDSPANSPADSPAPGTPAPDFTLPSSDGSDLTLSGLTGGRVVLYFYPKADTPGCTKQACGFRDAAGGFTAEGVTILGISPDPIKAVIKFAKKFDLTFPLLADENHAVCESYGVWREKSMYGKPYMGAARTTFILDAAGKVEKVFEKVKPEGHDAEVLAYLKGQS